LTRKGGKFLFLPPEKPEIYITHNDNALTEVDNSMSI